MDRDPGGVRGFRGEPERSNFLCGGIVAIRVNSLTLAPVFRVGADVNEIFTLLRGRREDGLESSRYRNASGRVRASITC